MSDPVNHPDHYNWMDIECIDVVQHFNFNVGNAIKYLWRAGWKDSKTHIEDLEKAKFYIEQEIGLLKAKALHPATKPTEKTTRVCGHPYDSHDGAFCPECMKQSAYTGPKMVRDAYNSVDPYSKTNISNYGAPFPSKIEGLNHP